jgi:hypothetical protein
MMSATLAVTYGCSLLLSRALLAIVIGEKRPLQKEGLVLERLLLRPCASAFSAMAIFAVA